MNPSTDAPRAPEKYVPTQEAWLPLEDERRATLHSFARFEAVDVSTLKYSADHSGPRTTGAKPRPAYALIYRCDETGAERRWGLI